MIRIRAQELGKSYPVYARQIDSLKEFFFRKSCHQTVWAVRDVELSAIAGSAIGIVGDNGAGKTTLLKLLAGAVTPSCGRLERFGRVSAILELGAGFHPDLSGYENIRIGCAVMGLSPAQAAEHLPAIIQFSELGSVLDRPVKTYSSGMYLRLAFSVATTVDPDILVIDEHLSVGDQHFRKKCRDRVTRLLARQTSLIFCSHDFYAIREICTDCLWLRNGRPAMFGRTTDVLEAYQDYIRAQEGTATEVKDLASLTEDQPPLGGDTCLRSVELGGDCRDGLIASGETLTVSIRARVTSAARSGGVHVGLLITRNDRIWSYGVSTKMDGLGANGLSPLGRDEFGIRMVLEDLPLLAGQYSVTVALLDNGSPHVYDLINSACEFNVSQKSGEGGMARLPHRWEPLQRTEFPEHTFDGEVE